MNNSEIDIQLQQILEKRKQEGLYRQLPLHENLIDFASNDYLGFAKNHLLFDVLGPDQKNGATGARLISGNSLLAENTENYIAKYHRAQAALIFNNGYMANLGLFSALSDKHTEFIIDEYIHASIYDGIRLGFAKKLKFNHNQIDDLEKQLKQSNAERKIVVVESVYSMDGDLAPLKEIVELCEQYQAVLIVDEAHATGIYGNRGEGRVVEMNLQDKVWARIHTYGKALGLHGASVIGSNELKNYLINYARSFIYTTALPPGIYIQIQEAYHLLENPHERELLSKNIIYFQEQIKKLQTIDIEIQKNNSPIQSIIVQGNFEALQLANHIIKQGYFVKAILSPTVPVNKERIRVSLHSYNTTSQIDGLIQTIQSYYI